MAGPISTGPLPAEPDFDAAQLDLSRRYLADPVALGALFGRLRRELDPWLAPRLPSYGGKPYPLGCCLEIRNAVFARLGTELAAPRCATAGALADFVRGGGLVAKIWGVLRDSYFQNAIQVGCWYVDVANDTVVATKPPVEVLPLDAAGLVPVADYRHFARIAERYWSVRICRNTIFPRMAPVLPLVCVAPIGPPWLAVAYDQVLELTRRAGFRPSLAAVRDFDDPPAETADRLRRAAADDADPLLQGGGDPVDVVARAVAEGRAADVGYRNACLAAHLRLERRVGRVAG